MHRLQPLRRRRAVRCHPAGVLQPGSAQASTNTLNPPYVMRFASNGIFFVSIDALRRGSFMTWAFTRSRCALDLNVIHANTTVSPGLVFITLVKGVPNFVLRSSPAHSL